MKIIFDQNEWNVEDSSKNIVEIAKEHDIYIPAPCYYKKSEDRCCKCCLILVDGNETEACNTFPTDGMNIIFNRDDLLSKRERNLTCYALGIPPENPSNASHSDHSHSHDSCGCGGDCSCGGDCGCGSH